MTCSKKTRLSRVCDEVIAAPLFAYGTLQIDEVLATLLGRIPMKTTARLHDWRAVRLTGRPYPGLVQATGYADGHLLTGLSPDEWILLDRFEDPGYEIRPVEVGCTTAWAYVWSGDHLDTEWDLIEFRRNELTAYLQRCAAWLAKDGARSDPQSS